MGERDARVDDIVARHLEGGSPGAAVAVLDRGRVVHRAAYGLADREAGIDFTTTSGFRICSVTKQFTCLLVRTLEDEGRLDLDRSPRHHLADLPAFMDAVSIRQLCQNVSGLRDYWCLAMLTGAAAETRFRRPDAERIIRGQRDFQTPPGSTYSYCNGNFLVLGWVVEAITGQPYPEVLAERILEPLGMRDTFVPGATSEALPGGTVGYEPAPGGGVMRAIVDIHWDGDAGIVSNLDDLIRWERNFDDDRIGLVETLYERPVLPGGVASGYAFGLRTGHHRGFPHHGHSGGLRGWRMCRMRFPTEGLSVIALFNHLTDAEAAVQEIADCYLPGDAPPRREPAGEDAGPHGFYLDPATGKGYEVTGAGGRYTLNAMGHAAPLHDDGGRSFTDAAGNVRITFEGGGAPRAALRDFGAGYRATLERVAPASDDPGEWTGTWRCEALDSTIAFEPGDGAPRVRIDGPLGSVEGWPARTAGADVVLLECQRSLDHRPPGEFVLWRRRGENARLVASCGLAHGVAFRPA